MCRFYIKRPKWLKLHPNSKNGRGQIFIFPICDEIISCNFIGRCQREQSLGVWEHLLKTLNLTRLLTVKIWLKLDPEVPTDAYQKLDSDFFFNTEAHWYIRLIFFHFSQNLQVLFAQFMFCF